MKTKRYTLDRIYNLIPGDYFYLVDENFSDTAEFNLHNYKIATDDFLFETVHIYYITARHYYEKGLAENHTILTCLVENESDLAVVDVVVNLNEPIYRMNYKFKGKKHKIKNIKKRLQKRIKNIHALTDSEFIKLYEIINLLDVIL